MTEVNGYVVEAIIGKSAYTVSLIATSEARAISRVRGTLFHHLRAVAAFDASYVVTETMTLAEFKIRRAAGLA